MLVVIVAKFTDRKCDFQEYMQNPSSGYLPLKVLEEWKHFLQYLYYTTFGIMPVVFITYTRILQNNMI